MEVDSYCLIWIGFEIGIITDTCCLSPHFLFLFLISMLLKRLGDVEISLYQFLIEALHSLTGALPGLLHPQRRDWPGSPAHRQHLHEPAQAPRVLRPAPDEEQAAVCHRVILRVRAELSWAVPPDMDATEVALGWKTENRGGKANHALTDFTVCVCACVPSRWWGNAPPQTERRVLLNHLKCWIPSYSSDRSAA